MKAHVALTEALADLIHELSPIPSAEITRIVNKWASNHFDVMGIVSTLGRGGEKFGGEEVKFHLVKQS